MQRVDFDGPVFLLAVGVNLRLAVADEPERHALHAARRQARHHLLPQQWGEVEADEVVHGAARLLCIYQWHQHGTRVRDGLLHFALGNFVEHSAVEGALAVDEAVFLEDFVDVPGDGLTLAVRVGREIDGGGFLRGLQDGLDVLFLVLFADDVVLHREAVRGVDSAFLGHEVADVAVAGKHLETCSQVLLDGLGLGGRFDDD